jgi:hypothetical protein
MVNITVPFLSIFDEPYEIRNSTVISFSPIIQVKNHGVVTNKAVYIKADNPITVYWLNYKSGSNDGGRVLSDEDLGQEYILPGDRTGGNLQPFSYEHFLLVSLKDGTIINIQYPDNTQETISLNRMETFRKRRLGISGTIVTSNEPIAVKSGHECFVASNSYCDLMSEQIPPVTALGSIHILGYMKPFLPFYLRIVIPFDQTDVTIYDENGNVVNAYNGLPRGDSVDTYYSINIALSVISTKNILVVQYGDSYTSAFNRDSSLMQVLSTERYVSAYDFHVPDNFIVTILHIIIASTLDPSGLLLDGMVLDVTQTVSVTVPGYGTYTILYSSPSVGHHLLTHADDNVFAAYLYGRRWNSEYSMVL